MKGSLFCYLCLVFFGWSASGVAAQNLKFDVKDVGYFKVRALKGHREVMIVPPSIAKKVGAPSVLNGEAKVSKGN